MFTDRSDTLIIVKSGTFKFYSLQALPFFFPARNPSVTQSCAGSAESDLGVSSAAPQLGLETAVSNAEAITAVERGKC